MGLIRKLLAIAIAVQLLLVVQPVHAADALPDIRIWTSGTEGSGVVAAMVRNNGDTALGNFEIRLTVPPAAEYIESWAGSQGSYPGKFNGSDVGWINSGVPAKGWQGPFAYRFRLSPAATAPVATARAGWQGTSFGQITSGQLSLKGIVGETGLRRTLLPNGLTVLTKERPDTETAAVAVSVRAGSRDEDDITAGGSHWLEHAHFLGTEKRPSAGDIDDAVQSVGGQMNASTGWETTNYFIVGPADRVDTALDVLSDILINSVFPRAAFDQERRVVIQELNLRANSPNILGFDLFASNLFKVHPARRLIGGTIQSVRDIPIETILAYRRQRYVAGNMTVAIVGRIGHDDAVNRAETAFARLMPGERRDRLEVVEPQPTAPTIIRAGREGVQASLNLGALAPSAVSPDSPAMEVIEAILGTSGRRLASEISDRRGLAANANFGYDALSDIGYWRVTVPTRGESVDEVQRVVLQELRRIKEEPVNQAEVDAAVRRIIGSERFSEESSLQQALGIAEGDALGILESRAEREAKLKAVTVADVQRVAAKYLDTDNYTLVVVTS